MKENFSIRLMAQFPPPIHGLSKAVDTLYHSRLHEKYHFTKINITDNKRFLFSIFSVLLGRYKTLYFTPAQSKWGNLRDLFYLSVAFLRHKPCIIHIHGGYFRQLIDHDCSSWQRKWNYYLIQKFAGAIVLGHFFEPMFKDLLPYNKLFVCPNCVDNDVMAPNIESKLNYIQDGSNPLHILYLSNFIESKGYLDVVRIAKHALMKGDVDKFIFHFAGKFFNLHEKSTFISKISEMNNVVYHGSVYGEKKKELLDKSQIFILLTRYPNEGQPISILEALGNGMAVITTDQGGIHEILTNSNGYVCTEDFADYDKIYKYLQHCYSNRDELIKTCKQNHEIALQKYTEEQYINNLDSIFGEVCKQLG